MKARRYFTGTAVLFIWMVSISAQDVRTSITPGSTPVNSAITPMNSVYVIENITADKKPVPYSYIREADVLWKKKIWRTIDLRQRQNISLRYPLSESMSGGERFSLFGLLMHGIESEEITPYFFNTIAGGWRDPFAQMTTLDEIYEDLEALPIYNEDSTVLLSMSIRYNDIMQFQIEEEWFFDSKHSRMDVRILGMAPVFYDYYDEFNNRLAVPMQRIPFVVYFPQCRPLFASHAVYNPNNDAQSISFDDFFFQRRFSSTIIAESNVYQNRMLSDYLTGQDVLLESERIKNDIFVQEHDMWEY